MFVDFIKFKVVPNKTISCDYPMASTTYYMLVTIVLNKVAVSAIEKQNTTIP